jgi:predicted amidophosphoribosyltransferase
MPGETCPVCEAAVPPQPDDDPRCPSCEAKLTRGDDGAWVLAGDAPAG